VTVNSKNTQDSLNHDLMEAIKEGELDLVRSLVEKGADVNHIQGPAEPGDWKSYAANTPLTFATSGMNFNKNIEIVRFLVEHGAEVNRRDGNLNLPIFDAVRDLNLEIVQYLIERGAKVDVFDYTADIILNIIGEDNGERTSPRRGNNLLYYVFHPRAFTHSYSSEDKEKMLKIATMLMEHGAVPLTEYLAEAIDLGSYDLAKLLIQKGVDVNSQLYEPKMHYTSFLEMAIDSDEEDLITLILESGAKITRENMRYAKKRNTYIVVKNVLKKLKIRNPGSWWRLF
jgi:ankyrin repeat protein